MKFHLTPNASENNSYNPDLIKFDDMQCCIPRCENLTESCTQKWVHIFIKSKRGYECVNNYPFVTEPNGIRFGFKLNIKLQTQSYYTRLYYDNKRE